MLAISLCKSVLSVRHRNVGMCTTRRRPRSASTKELERKFFTTQLSYDADVIHYDRASRFWFYDYEKNDLV